MIRRMSDAINYLFHIRAMPYAMRGAAAILSTVHNDAFITLYV